MRFLIKELGGVKRIHNEDVYIVTENVENSLNDILKTI